MPMLKDLIAFEMLLLVIIMVLVLIGMQLAFFMQIKKTKCPRDMKVETVGLGS